MSCVEYFVIKLIVMTILTGIFLWAYPLFTFSEFSRSCFWNRWSLTPKLVAVVAPFVL